MHPRHPVDVGASDDKLPEPSARDGALTQQRRRRPFAIRSGLAVLYPSTQHRTIDQSPSPSPPCSATRVSTYILGETGSARRFIWEAPPMKSRTFLYLILLLALSASVIAGAEPSTRLSVA